MQDWNPMKTSQLISSSFLQRYFGLKMGSEPLMTYRMLQNVLLVGCFLLLLVVLFPSFLLEKWESKPKIEMPKMRTADAATIVNVWTYQKTGLYYCPDSKFYGTLKPGRYMMQDKAIESGYRPAGQQFCR